MKSADKVRTGLGLGTLLTGLLRGKPLAEAQADARATLAAAEPFVREMEEPLEEFFAERRRKREAQAPRCPISGCVLRAGHKLAGAEGYCQDASGILFEGRKQT